MKEPVVIGDATLITADVLEGLRTLPADSVQCVVTSPPYWGLRDYGVPGMIGLEPTLQEWIDRLVEVFEEVKRVLRPDGTFWLNCGDAYAGSWKGQCHKPGANKNYVQTSVDKAGYCPPGFKPKDLLMMPARLAIALQEAGWWLRSEIIWAKSNPMPESVTDRPTSSHEKIYLLTKSSRYFYDQDAVREKSITGDMRRPYGSEGSWEMDGRPDEQRHGGELRGLKMPAGWDTAPGSHGTLRHNQPKHTDSKMGGGGTGFKGHSGNFDADGNLLGDPKGRNLRNVWTMATQPYPEAHFATFPEALPMKCILAGTSEQGSRG